jgi:general secretion pathway protein G
MSQHLFGTPRLCFRSRRAHIRSVENARPISRDARGINPRNARDAGFTILEILVVVTIIGLLIGLVAPAALRQLGGARTSVAKQSIERLGMVLDLYNLDMGAYPTTEQGLEALVRKPSSAAANWNGPYLKSEAVPVDPWNQPYIYRSPSDRPGHAYDLCSKGGNAEAARQAYLCNP